jgi:uncharacterized protein YndB with AHSA1/START domain
MDRGSYLEIDGRPAVRFEREYPHPVERVWAAVTTSADLVHWFPSPVRIEPHAGGQVSFGEDPYTGPATGTVLTFEPPRRLAFTWGEDELRLELAPTAAGCRLTFVNVLAERDTAARNASGWDICLGELDKLLSAVASEGPHSDDAAPFQPIYDGYVAAGLPSGAEIPSRRD